MEKLSLPKNKIKVLLLENVHKNAVELFKRNGYGSVELVHEALDSEALKKKIFVELDAVTGSERCCCGARGGHLRRIQRKLARREEVDAGVRCAAALGRRIDRTDALDLVAEPLHAHRPGRPGREEVDDPAAAGDLAPRPHEGDRLVAEGHRAVHQALADRIERLAFQHQLRAGLGRPGAANRSAALVLAIALSARWSFSRISRTYPPSSWAFCATFIALGAFIISDFEIFEFRIYRMRTQLKAMDQAAL